MPLYEIICKFILEEIRSGHLVAGDRVMSEKELAEKFGVSRITSKHALKRLASMGVITRERGRGSFVSDAETNVRSDMTESVATSLSIKQARVSKKLVGMLVPGFSDAYGGTILHAVEKRAWELGIYLALKDTYGQLEVEEQTIADLVDIGCEGLIIFPVHGEQYNEGILRLSVNHFPLVLVDRYLWGIPVPSVHTDNLKASEDLTCHLLDLGHQNIAFFSPPSESTSSIKERLDGFCRALGNRGIAVRPQHLVTELRSTLKLDWLERRELIQEDLAFIQRFVLNHPEVTAFVACEYEIALYLQQVLRELGHRIPEDYSVVCFDHPQYGTSPPLLTHIFQDENRIGASAVDLLTERMQGRDVPRNTKIPYRLVFGPSSGKVRNQKI